MQLWLLQEKVAHDLERARESFKPTAEQAELMVAFRAEAASGATPRILAVAGSEAEICVEGVLTPEPDWWVEYQYGANTAYSEIIAALDAANADPNVKRIILAINSPGGQADGLYECVQAIEASAKPVTSRARCALSGAYAIAAATNRIDALSEASEFGCLGVVVEYRYWADQEIITIVNTESPDKRPDPRTPEGKASIKRYLDDTYAWFAGGIARGREVSLDDVDTNFGRGAVLMAADAKKRRMIDGLAAQRARNGTRSASRASAQSTPEPGGPELNPVTGEEIDSMNKQLIAQALGLAASASDEAIEAGAVAFAQAKKDADALVATAQAEAKAAKQVVERFEKELGATGDAAFGALAGHIANSKKLAEVEALADKQMKDAEVTRHAQLVKDALDPNGASPYAGKLTQPVADLWKDKSATELESYLKVSPRLVPKSLTQPKTSNEADPAVVTEALKHNGKSWAEMTGTEKAALKRSDLPTYTAMRNAALKIAG